MRCMIDQQRKKRGMTWNALADATGIRKASLLAYDKGTAKSIRPEHIDALCTLFAVPVADLLVAEVVALPLDADVRPNMKGNKYRSEGAA